MADDWRPVRLALFGVGQVGTMLGLALRRGGVAREIRVADPNPATLAASRARGLQPDGEIDPEAIECDADVIVLAAPGPQIIELVERLGPGLGPGQLLIDTGSAKGPVVEAMRRLPDHVHAIGGHPMAGTEVPGPAGARPEALADAPFALTPVRDDPVALARGQAFARLLGARPVVVSAADHDRVVARTSHLPHISAYALAAVAAQAGDRATIEELTGTGLQGATRLAASDPEMVAAFLSANRAEVKTALKEFRGALGDLERALDEGPDQLTSSLADAASQASRRVSP